MTTIYDKIKEKLESHKDFRERRFRRDKLAILALRDLDYENKFKEKIPLTLDQLAEFASKYDSYRHEYDAVMRDNQHLRGEDYEDGKILAQEKQIEFGYEPSHFKDKKTLSKITNLT